MSKHKLYSSFQNSPVFNTSRELLNPKVQLTNIMANGNTEAKCLNSATGEKENEINTASGAVKQSFDFPFDQEYSASEPDSMDDDFFPAVTHSNKIPYSLQEDELILSFVLKGQNIFRTSSLSLWKHLEMKKDNPKRTYQSLKNRFLRNIKPNIFKTYGYLIKDKQTIDNILTKFPELKKNMYKTKTVPKLNLPQRHCLQQIKKENEISNSVSEGVPMDVEKVVPVQNKSKIKKTRSKKTSSKKQKTKQIGFNKNEALVITVNLGYESPTEDPREHVGIYEKFMRLKKKNVLVPCSKCGRGGFEPVEIKNSVEGESDDFIANSVELPNKVHSKELRRNVFSEVSSLNLPSSSTSQKSKRGRPTKKKKSESPSLIKSSSGNEKNEERVSRTRNVTNNKKIALSASNESNSSGAKRAKVSKLPLKITSLSHKDRFTLQGVLKRTEKLWEKNSSRKSNHSAGNLVSKQDQEKEVPVNDSLNDSDMNSLYNDVVTNCQKFLGSDDEGNLVKDYMKKQCRVILKPYTKNCKVDAENLDSFFAESDSMPLGSLTINTESQMTDEYSNGLRSDVISEDVLKTPLAQNMVKMLSEASKEK